MGSLFNPANLGAVTHLQNNSAQKDFSHMLNTTANKSSVLLGDHLCSSSFEPHNLGAPGAPLSQA
jgi:hypothetical protein